MPRFQPAQPRRRVQPKERYRATQYDHLDYNVVEDDRCGQGRSLEQFAEQLHHREASGRHRQSFVPTSSRLYDSGAIVEEQPALRTTDPRGEGSDDKDQQLCRDESFHTSLSRSVHNANSPLESSSDVAVGASSSPALNAGRRRAGHRGLSLFERPSELQTFEDSPSWEPIDFEEEDRHIDQTDACFYIASQHAIGRPIQQIVKPSTSKALFNQSAPPAVQGIPLVPVSALPDRLRTVFPFPAFNAVQSKCFDRIFKSDNNFVLSSPTGSGKTAVLELAICRAVAVNATGQYKVVYQAPTKSLCSERQRDWEKRFTQVGLKCVELTGDSNVKDLRNVQSANIIITTPEKWDSITRKWKDHEKLLKLVKLFLIDEVHILNDDRGAILEAVVSRMKSISTGVRFVALSATIPNFRDIAIWLGESSIKPYIPAPNEKFGEEFRPVKLKRYVHGYAYNGNNDWAFEKQLDTKLPNIITKHSERKPTMIFCATRKSCAATATFLANWWSKEIVGNRPWDPPSQAMHFQGRELRILSTSGVAFHHAGVDLEDRLKVEKAFLRGDISVICCTSTLAIGVNLPCHLVIIKNTMSFTQGGGLQQYSDLNMIQMLGRAGRPQFDSSAVAVIMTRQTKVRRYENLVTGEEVLESKLHLNLIEHMNAEIGLGTIRDLKSARKWLTGTFLYVRLQQNPAYYKLESSRSGQNIQEQVNDICFRDITLLKEHNLAADEDHLRCTEFGHAMARYYVQFETMKVFMGLRPKSTLSEILSAVAQAAEFSKIRFRQGEKSVYKILNKSPFIRLPIPVNLDLPAQKVSLIIQSSIGHADMCWDDEASKHKPQYMQEVTAIFKSVNSLVRCIVDCQIFLGDSVSIQSALMLERALGSKAWDDSPLRMVQIPEIGAVAVRKLVKAGIRSIEDLEATDARRIETVVGRNPPFGLKVLQHAKSFPKLRISLHIRQSSGTKTASGVKIQVRADIGFMNEKPPAKFIDTPIYVCMLAETSDGRKAHFVRISGFELGAGQSLMFPVLLTSAKQRVNCYLMCEGMAGTLQEATVVPRIAPDSFPPQVTQVIESAPIHKPNVSRRRIESNSINRSNSSASDEFGDADIDDDAFVRAVVGDLDFEDIDNFAEPKTFFKCTNTVNTQTAVTQKCLKGPSAVIGNTNDSAPVQLPNGRWSCNHKCKDKEGCKHQCCKTGMDRPPKKPESKQVVTKEHNAQSPHKSSMLRDTKMQTKLQLAPSKREIPTDVDELDLTQPKKKRKREYVITEPHGYRDLHNLHRCVQKDMPLSLHSVMHKKPPYCYSESGEYQLSCLDQAGGTKPAMSSEYRRGDLGFDELGDESSAVQAQQKRCGGLNSLDCSREASIVSRASDPFGVNVSMFNDANVGLEGYQTSQQVESVNTPSVQNDNAVDAFKETDAYADVSFPTEIHSSAPEDLGQNIRYGTVRTSARQDRKKPHRAANAPFVAAERSPWQFYHSKPRVSTSQSGVGRNSQYCGAEPLQTISDAKQRGEESDVYSDLLNILNTPLPTKEKHLASEQALAPHKTMTRPIEVQRDETQHIPEGFKDLEPWLFQHFGHIVELVDE